MSSLTGFVNAGILAGNTQKSQQLDSGLTQKSAPVGTDELFIVFSVGVVWEKCINSQEHLWWEKTTTAKTNELKLRKIFGITSHCSFEDGNMLEITTPPPPPLVSLAAVFSIVTQRSFGGEERYVTRQRTAARETTPPPPHPSHKRERNIKRKGKTKEYQADFSFAILGFKT